MPARPRVLVIDDDEGLQKLVKTLLDRAQMDVISAYSAADAVEALRARPLPSVVILDLMLPDVSGLDFLRQMRTKEIFDNLPVVILSALADPEKIREGLSSGADRYITKPYLAANLVPTIQDTLRIGRRK
jgi:two-component system phosphate regulon response regulator PhoB